MCLISRQKVPLIATKDIVCYKVIRAENDEVWKGYYWGGNFKFGKEVFTGDRPCIWEMPITKNTIIEGGFFHAFINYEDARSLYIEDEGEVSDIKLVKCIIPKGNEYYISKNNIEICSPSIIVYKDFDSYDKSMRVKCSAIIIYFKTIFNKFLNVFK